MGDNLISTGVTTKPEIERGAPELQSPTFPFTILRLTFVVAVLLSACGDNLEPQRTWGDAESAWSTAWCSLVSRCQPSLYRSRFSNDAACLAYVIDVNCKPHGATSCDELYPHPWWIIEECAAEMTETECNLGEPPPACLAAFSEVSK